MKDKIAVEYPVDLLEAFDPKDGQGVVAFVGTGPSIDAGLPGWGELIRRIAAEIRLDAEIQSYLNRGEFLQAAQYLAHERSEEDVQNRVVKHIKRTSSLPGRIHKLLMNLPFAGIITTNYDLLLTAADDSRRYNLPIHPQNSSLYGQIHERFLLHLHGHIGDPKSIVLTRQSYDRIILDNPQVRPFLSSIFQTRTVLFIGFGFADEHLDEILRDFKNHNIIGEASVFGLIPKPIDSHDRVQEHNLRFRYINPIYLADNGDYGVEEICVWLEDLRKALDQIRTSYELSVRKLRPQVIAPLQQIFASPDWLPLLANALDTLPNRPDLKNLVRIGLTRADAEKLFQKLGLAEMRLVLIALNQARPTPALKDALSCFPPA